jgi:hypothetical protein
MNCQQCGSKIGIARLISDRQFCSDEHRRKAQSEQGRNRRARWVHGDEDLYDVDEILDQPADQAKKKQLAKVQAGAAMALSIVLVFVLAFSWMGNGPTGAPVVDKTGLMAKLGGGGNAVGAVALSGGMSNGIFSALQGMIPTRSPIRLKEDFKAGLDAWVGAVGAAADWTTNNGALAPGQLRIWQPSVNLANYKVEFEASIDRKAVNWTYRSLNLDNFYASKIVQKRPGSLEIIRYAVLDGREQVRTKLPVPLMPGNKSLYRVQMQVRGDQFTTFLNGQVIDTWADTRLRRGGVGFFSEPGERSLIHWVSVNEESEGLLGQILSLGFFVAPAF